MSKTAWLFPGQGTQSVGMGKALHDASPAARRVFERADSALGFALSALCFGGPLDELTLTKNAQPAILTTSIAALAALREAIPSLPAPDFAAGHSLGEYSALVAAGALDFEDAVRLVRLRGEAMQAAVPEGHGGMAAILGSDEASVRTLCDDARDTEVLEPANFNAPGQIVIAGHAGAVKRASELAGSRKMKAILLNVSAPFHSPLMGKAAAAVEAALAKVQISPLAFPVVSNVDGTANDRADRVASLLVRQMDGAVLWEQSIRFLAEAGVVRALELGPGKVLAGLVKKIDKRIAVHGVADPDGVTGAPAFLG